jgi:hypothetical protein
LWANYSTTDYSDAKHQAEALIQMIAAQYLSSGVGDEPIRLPPRMLRNPKESFSRARRAWLVFSFTSPSSFPSRVATAMQAIISRRNLKPFAKSGGKVLAGVEAVREGNFCDGAFGRIQ